MASTSSLLPSGTLHKSDLGIPQNLSLNMDIYSMLPLLNSPDYYTEPSISKLAERETSDPGYCSRVPNFVLGRVNYGQIKFLGLTDVRRIYLDQIVKFKPNSVTVYENEADKPPVGHGLNKPAEVTLMVKPRLSESQGSDCKEVVEKLRACNERQGAEFLSFSNFEWRFKVNHFSRFGLDEEDGEEEPEETEEDLEKEDFTIQPVSDLRDPITHNGYGFELSHSLPAHLGLDPVKMQEMRMLMFPNLDDQEEQDIKLTQFQSTRKINPNREYAKVFDPPSPTSSSAKTKGSSPFGSPFHGSSQRMDRQKTYTHSPSPKKSPQKLLEYNVNSPNPSPSRAILLTGQSKGPPVQMSKLEGFKLEGKPSRSTPVSGQRLTNCITDSGLFMGRSFRVGWGPNGILIHSGSPVCDPGHGLASTIHIERVAADSVARDDRGKTVNELAELCLSSPLEFHKSLDHEFQEIKSGRFKLNLCKLVADRSILPDICRGYIELLEKQLEISDLPMSYSYRPLLLHKVSVWDLIRVLFSERREGSLTQLNLPNNDYNDGDEMILEDNNNDINNINTNEVDEEAIPLERRAKFSNWVQDNVVHRVQEELTGLTDSSYLDQILLFLTGRQLDQAAELAVSKGDVRLAILLSQAGGSVQARSDISQQLNLWRMNGLDFGLIEPDRLKIYEMLGGDVHEAVQDWSIDWKRYLGLIMWYQSPPDTPLPVIISTYQQLLMEGKVPDPVPVYIEDGVLADVAGRSDISYYLMLLHASTGEEGEGKERENPCLVKSMFSAFSCSNDPLDHLMIWHMRSVLEAIGVIVGCADLNLLDMSFAYQLLCAGKCHWAIYVVLHMGYINGAPYIHEKAIKEILSQYVESWSKDGMQWRFIEELSVPIEWMHEALAIYYEYYGDRARAMEHFIGCGGWQKAHTIFMTSVAHSLFLSSKDSEIWRITNTMEMHKSEIADWDLGAGIFIDFYDLRRSMQEENTMTDSDPLENKNEECKRFFDRLNDSLLIWGSRIPVHARAAYSKMTEELSSLLVATPGERSPPDVQMSCCNTILAGSTPDDRRSSHLQQALSVFTYLLSKPAS